MYFQLPVFFPKSVLISAQLLLGLLQFGLASQPKIVKTFFECPSIITYDVLLISNRNTV